MLGNCQAKIFQCVLSDSGPFACLAAKKKNIMLSYQNSSLHKTCVSVSYIDIIEVCWS